jgi:hypothetical protein
MVRGSNASAMKGAWSTGGGSKGAGKAEQVWGPVGEALPVLQFDSERIDVPKVSGPLRR